MTERPVWLVTGCSTGFGRDLCAQVLARGWRCVVTARDPRKIADLVAGHEERALALALDVTDATQVSAAVAAAERKFGGIDVLVNNAGHGYIAAVEEGEDAAIRAMFEANFFGLAAMIRAVLPDMRRRGSGHIVNISSMAGLNGSAGSGYYAASKFAVEGLSESLAKEVAPLGLNVTLVEPGPFRTAFTGPALRLPAAAIAAYDATAGARRRAIVERHGQQAGDPALAAGAIIAAVLAPRPPLHLVLGAQALEIVRQKLDALNQDLADWQATTLGTDFAPA